FLKMDIEGGEYPWLLSLSDVQLGKFKQIVIELHDITQNVTDCVLAKKIKCLKKLSHSHYLIHAHGNNYSHCVDGIPDVIELTYLNKNLFDAAPDFNTTALPIAGLDFPNHPNMPEIRLDFYPFVQR
ncbi:MAG: FkbM family methyltransferase, partial [Gloeobacteraceae cyanobacterium ES-bin-144]|nr:FkbM family methyltransferase [Verrucomicrobiales bacterium]